MKYMRFIVNTLMLLICTSSLAQTEKTKWDLYTKGEYEKAIQQGKIALESNPDNPQLNLAVGRALTDFQSYREAIPYLEKGKTNESFVTGPDLC